MFAKTADERLTLINKIDEQLKAAGERIASLTRIRQLLQDRGRSLTLIEASITN